MILNREDSMENVDVNYVAVVLAALSSFVVGMVWYSKPVFGAQWMKMVGMTEEKSKKGMAKAMSMSLVAALLAAYVLAHVIFLSHQFFGNSFLQDALSTALWVGIGLQASVIVVHDSFEQRRKKLTLMNIGNQLVTVLVMGLIIGLLGL